VSISWRDRLQRASSVDQVLELTHDFLTTWTPVEMARLPPLCRPLRVADADDVAFFAFELVREQCLDAGASKELQRMAAFFGTASGRLSELMANVSARDNKHWQQGHVR
jgi:hypothetical protein